MSATDFSKLMPGFDFLNSLMKGAGATVPGINPWMAPTLDPEELDKRIQELRTVQFWLEQNAKMLAAAIQGLEVQRMTLATLQSMNLPMADLRDALTIKPVPMPSASASASASPTRTPTPASPPAAASGGAPVVDPMQWWGALTRQFSELAATALKDTAPAGASPASPAPVAPQAAARAKPASAGLTKAAAKRAEGSGKGAAQSPAQRATHETSRAAAPRDAEPVKTAPRRGA
jgi:hypothetical protein